jgi:hypothetical protein
MEQQASLQQGMEDPVPLGDLTERLRQLLSVPAESSEEGAMPLVLSELSDLVTQSLVAPEALYGCIWAPMLAPLLDRAGSRNVDTLLQILLQFERQCTDSCHSAVQPSATAVCDRLGQLLLATNEGVCLATAQLLRAVWSRDAAQWSGRLASFPIDRVAAAWLAIEQDQARDDLLFVYAHVLADMTPANDLKIPALSAAVAVKRSRQPTAVLNVWRLVSQFASSQQAPLDNLWSELGEIEPLCAVTLVRDPSLFADAMTVRSASARANILKVIGQAASVGIVVPSPPAPRSSGQSGGASRNVGPLGDQSDLL